ncbi:PTS beta-glucoside transporter subunit EIIBCA [Vibrio cholerae]|nr:PTS beta-glucoside transporter subunit EIIBCA [Vibrio cholerae]
MSNKDLANQIVRLVGGEDNITVLFHCITRLRFNLKDLSKADKDAIADLDGVFGTNLSGDQFQVILGDRVSKVCDEIYTTIPRLRKSSQEGSAENETGEKSGKLAFLMETISSIFSPIIPAIAGAGILKGILALLLTFNILPKDSQNYQILNAISDGVFYLLPIVLAHSCSVRFKCNSYVAMAIAAALFHPSLSGLFAASKQSGIDISFFGLPITPASYASSVIPIILAIWLMSYVEKFIDRFMPGSLKTMFVPLFTLIIVTPITLSVLGPIGLFLGGHLTGGVLWLLENMGWLAGLILGGTMSVLIITGMHYTLVPVMVNNVSTMGFDPIKPIFFVANLGQAGAAFGVFLRAKDKKLKSLALSVSLTAAMGITEPAMYGVNIRLKKPFFAALIGGALGGAFAVTAGVKAYAFTMSGLPGIPALAGPTFFYAIGSMLVSFVAAAAITFVVGFEEKTNSKEKASEPKASTAAIQARTSVQVNANETIFPPVKGEFVKLENVSDPVFATETFGKGLAIKPSEGIVTSPVKGVVNSIFPTKHAIAITSDKGAEILIHIGVDTVKLKGKYFTSNIKDGDLISIGQPLIEFELDSLENEGFDTSVIMVVTNTSDYQEFTLNESIREDEHVIKLAAQPSFA